MSFLIVLYEFGIMPFLLGMLWCQKGKKLGLHGIYIHGYMTMLALFFLIAVPFIHMQKSLSALTNTWSVVSIGTAVVWGILFFVRRKTVMEELRRLAEHFKFSAKNMWGMIGLVAVVIVVSIAGITPSAQDSTPELAAVSIKTDTMYVYQPYTYIPYEDNSEGANSPLAMLYAVCAKMSGMNATILIHLFVPFFFILVYVAVGWSAAEYFFRESWKKKKLFTEFWVVTATVIVGADRALSVGVYQNIWNGVSFITCCILPLAIVESLAIADELINHRKINRIQCMFFIVTALSAQLSLKNGIVLAALILVLCAAVEIVRKGIGYVRKH